MASRSSAHYGAGRLTKAEISGMQDKRLELGLNEIATGLDRSAFSAEKLNAAIADQDATKEMVTPMELTHHAEVTGICPQIGESAESFLGRIGTGTVQINLSALEAAAYISAAAS